MGARGAGLRCADRLTGVPVATSRRERFGALELVITEPGSGPTVLPPLLLVHGNYHGAWAWERWVPRLAEAGFSSVAVSLRGHGGSDPLDVAAFCRLTAGELAEDVTAVHRHLGRRSVLIGHSLGGLLCQAVAAIDDATALVLVASAAPAAIPPTRPLIGDPSRPIVFDRAEARRRLFHAIDDADFERVFARLGPGSPGVLNTSGGRMPVATDHVRCPVLVTSASADASSVPPGETLAALYGALHLRVEGAGHDLMLETAGDAVLAPLIDWLRGACRRSDTADRTV